MCHEQQAFLRLKDLAQKENRARLAVLLGVVGCIASSCCRSCSLSGKTAATSAAPADDNVYRQRTELQELSDLITQVEGAERLP